MLRALDAAIIKKIVLAAADVAVVVDADGVVRDLAFRSDDLRREFGEARGWLGQRWRGTMTVESRPKLDALLADAATDRPLRWRHLNHSAREGADVAISYSAVRLSEDGAVIALGRDLRPISALQQRLVEAQQALEQDYQGLRQAEARYRMLFETAQDAVAILDAATHKVVELNPAARRLLGSGPRRSGPQAFVECFAEASRDAVRQALGSARATGRSEAVEAETGIGPVEVAVSALREEDGLLLLVRVTPRHPAAVLADPLDDERLPGLLEQMPDAVALTDEDGDILAVNAAFRALVGLADAEPVRGEPLGRWVGQAGIDLGVLIANLRQRRTVRLFATTLRTETGGATEVEISASTLSGVPAPGSGTGSTGNGNGNGGFAFFIRDVARRLPGGTEGRLGRGLTQSVDRMSELIGRVSLKELVRESTDAIERLCIEAALDMTGNNRASAAEMLGLSRQSLYVKLRRYGFSMAEDDAT